ncbi:MAG: peptidase domain-containing ABC transporter [Cyclobacteriaceae bacterium]
MKFTRNQLKKFHVQQLGEFACGLACISALSRYYGGDITQEKLREISGTTLQGTSLLGLYQAAQKVGFEAKGLEGDIEHLKDLNHPVILHVVMDNNREHYIVCYGFENGMFTIGDPGWGITTFSESELEVIWQSKALLSIKPKSDFQTKKDNKLNQIEWFKSLIREDISILTVAAVIGIVMAVLGLSTAIFTQKLIDDFLPNNSTEKIVIGFCALFVLLVARAVFGLIRGIFMARQGRDLNVRIIKSFIEKLIRLPIPVLSGFSTGDLIARMNDSLRIRNTVALLTGNVLISILVVLVSTVYLSIVHLQLGLFSLSSLIIFLLIAWRYHPNILEKQKEVMLAHSANETQYIDALTGVRTVRSFAKEEVFTERIDKHYEFYQTKGYELGLLANRFGFVTQFTVGTYITLVFAAGVWFMLQSQLQLGELMAILTITGSMIPSLAGLVTANIQLQEAKVAFNRMHELASMNAEVQGGGHVIQPNGTDQSSLQINDLSFAFPGSGPLLKELNLEIPSGKIVALFGYIGSGKSTLVELIQRNYSLDQGDLLINGNSSADYDLTAWRKQIGVVSQSEKIFNTTVLDNISLSNNPNDIIQCEKEIRDTYIGKLLSGLPQGLLTICGEEGSNLSGGQKQLVAIVRAIYKKPSFLILDESTSEMDQHTEQNVLNYLKKIAEEENMGILFSTPYSLDHLLLL